MGSRERRVELRARSHAEAAFGELYDRWYADVWAYCRRRVPAERTDDVVAETFLTAWRRIDDVPDGLAARPWLYRVAYRTVGHEWRAGSRRRRLETRLRYVRPAREVTPEESTVADDELARVIEAARRLRHDDAELLRLVAWERLPTAEIAEVLDIAPNTVSQRVRRARARLAEQFARSEGRSTDRTAAVRQGGAR